MFVGGELQLATGFMTRIEAGVTSSLTEHSDSSASEVYSCHVLQRLHLKDAMDAVREYFRVLKPGGVVKISVPDVGVWADQYAASRRGDLGPGEWLPSGTDLYGEHGENVEAYDIYTLRSMLWEAGFEDVRGFEPFASDMSSHPSSAKVAATKPAHKNTNLRGIVGMAMSVPRLGFTDSNDSLLNAVYSLRMGMRQNSGAWWGKSLQDSITQVMEDGCKYVLTVDYDTVFEPWHVKQLYAMMETNPDIDALFPLQAKREKDLALMYRSQPIARGEMLEHDMIEVDSGHFGLTMLRADSLRDTAKPWFLCEPREDGEYKDGWLDPDIYFWRKFRAAGHKVCVTPRVSVGHAQMVVSWVTRDLGISHQYRQDYRSFGKPREARW